MLTAFAVGTGAPVDGAADMMVEGWGDGCILGLEFGVCEGEDSAGSDCVLW